MQAGMCDEVFGSLGSPSAGEILRRGLCCDRRRWGATATTAAVALAKAATRLKALDFELREDVLQLQQQQIDNGALGPVSLTDGLQASPCCAIEKGVQGLQALHTHVQHVSLPP
jgi:hypothetical protein